MGSIGQQITVVIMAIVGVAVLSVILSKQANTSNVIGAAVNPVSGGSNFLNTSQGIITNLTGSLN